MACTFKPACVSVCGTWICRCLKPPIVQEHGGKQAGYHAAVCAVHKRGCHTEQPDCEKQVSLQRLVRLRCISRPSLESSKPNPSIHPRNIKDMPSSKDKDTSKKGDTAKSKKEKKDKKDSTPSRKKEKKDKKDPRTSRKGKADNDIDEDASAPAKKKKKGAKK